MFFEYSSSYVVFTIQFKALVIMLLLDGRPLRLVNLYCIYEFMLIPFSLSNETSPNKHFSLADIFLYGHFHNPR